MTTTNSSNQIKPINFKFLGPTNHRWLELDKDQARALKENYDASTHLNRTPAPDTVETYKKDMDSGNWEDDIDESAILIDKDCVVRGGLHRITAFLASTQDRLKVPVVFPASEKEIRRQDSNRARTRVNNNEMNMSKALYNSIQSFEFLPNRTIHSIAKILCMEDNHPGLNKNNKADFKSNGEKHNFTFNSNEVVKTIEKYLPIFQEIEDHAYPFDKIVDGHKNYAKTGPFVAAFAKAYTLMDKPLWKKMVGLLTYQVNMFDELTESNSFLATKELLDIFYKNTKQNNPIKIDQDVRSILTTLACAKNNVDIRSINKETYGYETFIK